ncbi:His-Xaa-Ser system radical SAM maturase HxsB [Parasedimentitalea maritima]|uniref:His-Xaa-Ser system radical SAM maturase HxsB n=1 Tax=Parasedimentitalea maritima TaxID=2578117 RepID=UPI00131C0217|nr:His-Xaa-Ser system radical SAM maturase HxsB [Zongyanglinia marina]
MNDKLAALQRRAQSFRRAERSYIPSEMSYLILVPTLRCNLACSYCQVSRVAEKASGFDWNEETLNAVLGFIQNSKVSRLKVEFQGGEPLLALPLLQRVRDFCRSNIAEVEFVICTNLQSVSQDSFEFLSHEDVTISTSFDGTQDIHRKQRMSSDEEMQGFLGNVRRLLTKFGPNKLSALPTLDPECLPRADELLDSYLEWGMNSVFLRPVANYGFARKVHEAEIISKDWYQFHREVVDEMIQRNFQRGTCFEDYYLSLCLRRMLRSDINGHVDLRNPNLLGKDYIVIDYDGTFYPTDEARMLTRTGQIDLSIGHVSGGIDQSKLNTLNANSSNFGDPDCDSCRHQVYCGRDVIDDLSRYSRIDLPRSETEFCKRHKYMFGLVEDLLQSPAPAVHHSLALWAGIPEWDSVLSKAVQ